MSTTSLFPPVSPCAAFRAQHLCWLDSALAASDAAVMRAHADGCAMCARYDADIRVGLLLARHTQPMTVSPGFRVRLEERLKLERFVAGPRRGPLPNGSGPARLIGRLIA